MIKTEWKHYISLTTVSTFLDTCSRAQSKLLLRTCASHSERFLFFTNFFLRLPTLRFFFKFVVVVVVIASRALGKRSDVTKMGTCSACNGLSKSTYRRGPWYSIGITYDAALQQCMKLIDMIFPILTGKILNNTKTINTKGRQACDTYWYGGINK